LANAANVPARLPCDEGPLPSSFGGGGPALISQCDGTDAVSAVAERAVR
jgi:hypothetical protein